jgi:hypothetical protein
MQCILKVLFALLIACGSLIGQITTNALFRVLPIRFNESLGSSFILEIEHRQYLITAKHIVTGAKPGVVVQILHPATAKWTPIEIGSILDCGSADIAVLAPSSPIGDHIKNLPVVPSADGMILGGEVYFLGFPYGFGTPGSNFGAPSAMGDAKYLIPFVKRATIAAMVREGDAMVLYLDGYNNPGFSGGPVVIVNSANRDTRFIGVISAYRNEPRPVRLGQSLSNLTVDSNTGIVVAYGITAAVEAIKKKPTGAKVDF